MRYPASFEIRKQRRHPPFFSPPNMVIPTQEMLHNIGNVLHNTDTDQHTAL